MILQMSSMVTSIIRCLKFQTRFITRVAFSKEFRNKKFKIEIFKIVTQSDNITMGMG